MRLGLALSLVLSCSGWSLSAQADGQPTAAERLQARTLFEEGRAAMKGGDFASACPKLEDSQRLAPGIGTLYNLADCYRGIGRIATAWTTFSDVAEAAQRAGQPERAAAAKERADSLIARLPHVRVVAPSATGLTLSLDGIPFASGLVGSAVPVDPGDHTLGADAPGKKHGAARFQATEGESTTVAVPVLELAVESMAPLPPSLPVVPPPSPPGPPPAATIPSPRWQGPVALSAAGLGAVGIVLGSVFGVEAIHDWSRARPGCPGNVCTIEAYPSWQSAHSASGVSTGTFVAGAALVGAAAVVWFTRPREAAVRVGVRGEGIVVEGRLP